MNHEHTLHDDPDGLLQASATALPPLAELAVEWRDLEGRSDGSFFTSWHWMGTWLRHLPASCQPRLVRVARQGVTMALGVVCQRRTVRRGLVRSHALHLNSTGDAELDNPFIEYNCWLRDRCLAPAALDSLPAWLMSALGANEFRIPGSIDRGDGPCARGRLRRSMDSHAKTVHRLRLDAARERGGDFMGCLSANRRSQLRRTLRAYEALGPVQAVAATTPAEVTRLEGTLVALHNAYWQAKGKGGSFASPFTRAFHRDLVREGLADGSVVLLEVLAGNAQVGVLYLFNHRGHVYFYQSGLDYGLLAKDAAPGYCAHAAAIRWATARGAEVYDFLAGDARYKKTLSNESAELYWVTLQRPLLRFALERFAMASLGRLRRVVAS